MKTTIQINGKDVQITLTPEQVKAIKKAEDKITDRVKSFDDACEVLNIDNYNAIPYDNPTGDTAKALNACAKLIIIAKALNEGWKPNWEDSSESKWHPWFKFKSGFGFSYTNYVFSNTHSAVGSRLCFKTRELAEYAGTQFEAIYKEYLTL